MKLESIFDELNEQHFEGKLPRLQLRWNKKLRTTAGRFAPGSRNLLRRKEPYIEVATYLESLPEGAFHVRDTILHEMIHYWLWWNKKPYGHTKEFHQIMKKVGARRYNPVPKESPIKYWYECLHCKVRVPARRKLGRVACSACCKKHNKGKFSERYVLNILDGNMNPAPMPRPLITREELEHLPYEEAIQRLEAVKKLILSAKIKIVK